MIIVTGVDNTGKTTLVNHLVDKFKDRGLKQIEKYPTLPPTDGMDWAGWVVNKLITKNRFTIADRFYVEEFVYGPLLRGSMCIDSNIVRSINTMIMQVKPLIIWCNTDIETIRKTFMERAQLEGVYERIGKLQHKFEEVLNSFPFDQCPQYTYNFKTDPDYKTIDQVVDAWITREEVEYERR